MPNPGSIRKLRQQQRVAQREVERLIQKSRAALADKIHAAAQDANNLRRQRFRDHFFNQVHSHYQLTGAELDRWGREMTERTAIDWHRRAIFETRRQGRKVNPSIIKYDRRRTERYFRMIHPDQTEHLAAVFTKKMAETDIAALRQATVEVFRRGSVEGLTRNQIQKELQTSWDKIAGNIDSHRFIDARGRKWSNRDYIRMLTRTTSARVSRESYMDTIIGNGDDLVRIVPSGESCEICDAWIGLIISISGKDKRFPSYQAALDAGMFHPNCDCFIRRMDETIHMNDIDRQAAQPNVDWSDREQVAKYKTDFQAASPAPGDKTTLSAALERPAVARKAKKIVRRARAVEDDQSATMAALAEANDAELVGLNPETGKVRYAVKEEGSTTRKIAAEIKSNPSWPLDAIDKKNVHDSLRYTMVMPDDKYTDGVINTSKQLRALGYRQVQADDGTTKFRNAWTEEKYKGINTVWRRPDGIKVELQFHTPRGIAVKEKYAHPLYEKIRLVDPNDPKQAAAAARWKQQNIDAWATVPTPPGANRITKRGTLGRQRAIAKQPRLGPTKENLDRLRRENELRKKELAEAERRNERLRDELAEAEAQFREEREQERRIREETARLDAETKRIERQLAAEDRRRDR